MQNSSEKTKMPMKIEFVFQIALILFIILGSVIKQASWIFWILAFVCALFWMIAVKRQSEKEDEENKCDEV